MHVTGAQSGPRTRGRPLSPAFCGDLRATREAPQDGEARLPGTLREDGGQPNSHWIVVWKKNKNFLINSVESFPT